MIIIFGAAGDLTWRKLVPALYNLFLDKWLPERFKIIGLDRHDMDQQQFAGHLRDGVEQFSRQGLANEAIWSDFAACLDYISADFEAAQTFNHLAEHIEATTGGWDQPSDRSHLGQGRQIHWQHPKSRL